MGDKDLSKEELIKEIEALKKKISELEGDRNPDDEETAIPEDMSNLLNNVMQFAGFDIANLQFEFLNTMINNIPNPVYYVDSEGNYLGCNHSYEKFIGRKIDALKGKSIFNVLSNEVAEYEKEKDAELLKSNGLISYEIQFQSSLGKTKDILVSKSIFKNLDGSVAGIIGVINDISEKRAAERALIKSEQKLREANATKDKFFSIISHDLKSPFVTMLGFTEMLSDDYDDFDEETRKGFIKDIRESAQKSFGLMENLLQWSSSQRGEIEIMPEKLDLKELVDEAICVLEPVAKQKGVKINISIPEQTAIYADKNTISSVLRNLLSNAIKFNKENGEATISSQVDEKNVNVSITDTGLGLSEDDVNSLFRLDIPHKKIGKTTQNKGSGLGLILCKEFIDKNNGKIWVESILGNGSKFCFQLPTGE